MKRFRFVVTVIIVFLLTVAFASALSIGYNYSRDERQIEMKPKYDEYHDTSVTLISAPAAIQCGEEFEVTGRLVDLQIGEGLANQKVRVTWFGTYADEPLYVITDENGYFKGMKKAFDDRRQKPGPETLQAIFWPED